jgi:hypothetical protein
MPDDVLDTFVEAALGSPATCALRALHRVAPDLSWDDPTLLQSAAVVAWGFRTLFNQHESVALLRGDSDESYWRAVLQFCASHNLQAVLDEYAHYLVDAEGLSAKPSADRVCGVASAMANALGIRPALIDVDEPVITDDGVHLDSFHMRGRFAMRLGDFKDEDNAAERLGIVRDAFNSPFRPFVLASTSVGQEGLDFHPYCYRIYHWNLPATRWTSNSARDASTATRTMRCGSISRTRKHQPCNRCRTRRRTLGPRCSRRLVRRRATKATWCPTGFSKALFASNVASPCCRLVVNTSDWNGSNAA